jgi:hypothetical protein
VHHNFAIFFSFREKMCAHFRYFRFSAETKKGGLISTLQQLTAPPPPKHVVRLGLAA